MLHKTARESPSAVEFTIPLHEPLSSSYHVRVVSDRWLGCETSVLALVATSCCCDALLWWRAVVVAR